MGLLIDGKWHDQWYDTDKTGGRFEREASAFRNWAPSDGAPGPPVEGGCKAAPGPYHPSVPHASPRAHRPLTSPPLTCPQPHFGVSLLHSPMRSHA